MIASPESGMFIHPYLFGFLCFLRSEALNPAIFLSLYANVNDIKKSIMISASIKLQFFFLNIQETMMSCPNYRPASLLNLQLFIFCCK